MVAALGITAIVVALMGRSMPMGREHVRHCSSWIAFRLGLALPGTIPFVVGAASVLAGSGGGLYWIFAGILGALIGAVANAWVLLVEIQR